MRATQLESRTTSFEVPAGFASPLRADTDDADAASDAASDVASDAATKEWLTVTVSPVIMTDQWPKLLACARIRPKTTAANWFYSS